MRCRRSRPPSPTPTRRRSSTCLPSARRARSPSSIRATAAGGTSTRRSANGWPGRTSMSWASARSRPSGSRANRRRSPPISKRSSPTPIRRGTLPVLRRRLFLRRQRLPLRLAASQSGDAGSDQAGRAARARTGDGVPCLRCRLARRGDGQPSRRRPPSPPCRASACFASTASDEVDSTPCTDASIAGLEILQTSGGHHFDGDYVGIGRKILDAFDRRA